MYCIVRSPRPALARGVMQLYSVEQAKSQPLEAHAAAFSTVKFAGRDLPSNVISFAQKTLKDGQVLSKLHVIELGNAPGAWRGSRGRGALTNQQQRQLQNTAALRRMQPPAGLQLRRRITPGWHFTYSHLLA